MPELLTLEEVIKITKMSKASIHRRRKDGSFPQPVQVGPRSVRFRSEDVQDWLSNLPLRAGSQQVGIAS